MAYGTNIPSSDIDEKGICILPDPSYYFGFNSFEQKDKGWQDGCDRNIYDIRKFISLALTCNPNIIEVLFVDEEDILYIDNLGNKLRKNRDIFLSQLAANTFTGYALSQLHRIKNHYRWYQDPPKKPKEEDFIKTLHFETQEMYPIPWGNPVPTGASSAKRQFCIELNNHLFTVNQPEFTSDGDWLSAKVKVEHFDKNALKTANKKYNQYENWKKNRNPTRAKLEQKYGFDCKHGMHLIRLLKMV